MTLYGEQSDFPHDLSNLSKLTFVITLCFMSFCMKTVKI